MLSTFRRATKSTVGIIIIAFIGLLIVVGFAVGDITGITGGGSGLSSTSLASAGSLEVTDRDISNAMQRRLSQVREQNPEADYSTIAGDFDVILEEMINLKALQAFAKEHGLVLSKRLIDGEIANLPGVRDLAGRVSPESYQAFLAQQRMTDAEVREVLSGAILQRLLLTPAASNARVPIGVATPYASMLLEERQGSVARVPIAPFAEGLNPSDQQVRQFYQANRNRYMIPEQRVLKLAPIGPGQVAKVAATPQEIEAYYKANQATYGAKDVRTISQAVVPSQQAAQQIAQRARGGQSFAAAAQPAGLSAEDVSVGEQTREQFAGLAGEQVASAAFAAEAGSVVGPIRSDLGWHVVKVESATRQAGRTLAQVRDEIAARITAEKRKDALADIVDSVQDAIDGGASFDEAARAANLQVTTTPMITASGVARGDPSYSLPEQLQPALRSGFEMAPSDEPVIDQLPGEAGFVLVAPARVEPAAPAPLASIADQVRQDWIRQEATKRARAAADAIASRADGKVPLSQAVQQANRQLPPLQPVRARRIQLTEMGSNVPAPLRVLFTTMEGKARVAADPEGRGFFVVKVDKIVPGNALNQPRLITDVQTEFSDPLAQEYAQQLVNAAKAKVGIKRNEAVIGETKKRITSPGL